MVEEVSVDEKKSIFRNCFTYIIRSIEITMNQQFFKDTFHVIHLRKRLVNL